MDFYNSYLIKISTITTLILLLTAIFNVFIDPFNFFDSPKFHNFNQYKPEFQTHVRMTKAHQVRRQQPEVIILGSSRAEFGLNPKHPKLSSLPYKRYNLALHSANIYEILRYLQHAQSIQPLKQVIIGLDFFMFNNNKQNETDFSEDRLAPSKTGWLRDIFQAIFTYDGVLSSFNTINKQYSEHNIQYFSNGFRNDSHNWARIKKKGGYHQAAIKNEQYTLYALDGFTFFSLPKQQSSSVNTFSKILIFCKTNNIDLQLFISPIHARKMQLLYQIGLWKKFEYWKNTIVQIIESNTPQYSIWDFTGYNKITTEPFPPLGDTTTQMKWYWESSHYKKETGDLILSKILNKKASTIHTKHSGFGSKLSSSSIDLHLNKIRKNRNQYQNNHPEIVEEINQMIFKTAPRRHKLINQHPDLTPLNYFKNISKLNSNIKND